MCKWCVIEWVRWCKEEVVVVEVSVDNSDFKEEQGYEDYGYLVIFVKIIVQ